MTLDEIIAAARSRAGDVDDAAFRYTKTEYVAILVDVLRTGAVRKINTLNTLTLNASEEGTLTPEASDLQGTYLAAATALRLLQQTYRRRLDEGSLGVSWMSGLEQESSISAATAYRGILDELAREVDELIFFGNATTFAKRPQ